ncbi:conserved hypothetical protein [Mucor ambiguus]|uniref:Gti1/Pac2 family protein n=1 Tax=Mucor ambiguus TaxID=91626 RepID=A0A0C9N3N8_9FUNG|nr:conserved hypothetical protein [Mucor ambiguus]
MPFTKTFHGFIENNKDALLIIEACRGGLLPTINRRLIERERSSIKSGTIIVFDETESGNSTFSRVRYRPHRLTLNIHMQIGIKRWTDGFLWSPSRILGNFLIYRELENREIRNIENGYSYSATTRMINDITEETNISLIQQRERALVGSLTTTNTTYNFKKDGLIKKTIRIMVNGNFLHIVNYYNKHDALNNLLPTPSNSPELACLQISVDLMPHLKGQYATTCNMEGTITKKRFNSSDYQQPLYQHGKAYNMNYSQSVYSSTVNGNKGSSELDDHSYSQLTSGTAKPVFDATAYYYSAKRSKASHDTPSPLLSPPNIVSTAPSPCGDTATLTNRFNQFYLPSSINISGRNAFQTGSSSTSLYITPSPRWKTV